MNHRKEHIVVVGNGMVGYKFCEKLTDRFDRNRYNISVFGEEPRAAYDRVHLSNYFTGTSEKELSLAPREWYEENGIALHTGELIVGVDRKSKNITTHQGKTFPYDKLILATGSAPFVPPVDGMDRSGVFVYRTLEDLDAIISWSGKVKKAAVVGGGLLGLEAARALLDLNLETHVVEFAPRLMPRQLDDDGSEILQNKLNELGLHIHLNKQTERISGNGSVACMDFADGESLDVEMIVVSAGIRPRDELARKCGLEVGDRGGIVVNDRLASSDPDIYAIGEAALHNGMIYGLVAPGYEMAEVVVDQLDAGNGEAKTFNGTDMSTKLKLIGVDVASFGDALGTTEKSDTITIKDRFKGLYKRINISEDGTRLLGGILVGDAADYNMLLQIAQNGLSLPPNPEDLILGGRGDSPSGNSGFPGPAGLPDSAGICSCENVSKGTICSVIEERDIEDVDGIKTATKAGSGCGGCVPILGDILRESLKARGKKIRNVLCEHFNYSRRELFDLIKVNEIKTFSELISRQGSGCGCEICKPAVASMLAGAWNDLVTRQDTIQDTNDRFLANIQKGGTYSVVPRVPGGEITPDKIITIGQVAKKYDLYTKITGGQRIDMFGARVEQLPDIWEELIDAGFESGHAYGKALRTVKSCVGSTWCRYGLHDSVSFALDVENRYKGLRAPHKLKGGVSGCIRECAEAQSKDFGIIATEKGWNLYVCGNGGSQPQHARLLASDIDEKTCIKYLDRFLMFYIKTAEPLNRTKTWLEKMEGGMDYLRSVIVDDTLGIGEQLEMEMQQLIRVYKCEWKEVVNNPELRKRFTHFINSDESDPTVAFKNYREQKIPAEWGPPVSGK